MRDLDSFPISSLNKTERWHVHPSRLYTLSSPLIASNERCKEKSSIDLIISDREREEWKKRISRCCRPSLGISGRRGIKLMSKSPQKRRILLLLCRPYVSCFDPPGRPARTSAVLQNDLTCVRPAATEKNREIKCRHLYVGATDSSCWHQIADIHPWISHHHCWMLTAEELHISGYAVIQA